MEQQRSGIPSLDSRRELSLELVYATEAGALACAGFLGKGDPDGVSDAAGRAMRAALEHSGLTSTAGLNPPQPHHPPPGMAHQRGRRRVETGSTQWDGAH